MEVEPNEAAARREYRGQCFYFSSEDAASRFDAAPARYAPAIPSATTGVAKGVEGYVRIALPLSGLGRSGGPALAGAPESLPGVRQARVNLRGRRGAVA